MSRLPPLLDLDAALASLPPEARQRRPVRPALSLISEAKRLLRVVRPLRAQFAELPGFELSAIDGLPALIDRVESAEIAWADARTRRAGVSLSKTRDEAIALRYRLVSAARRCFPDDARLEKRLAGFHRRRALPGLIGDLRKLADIVDRRPEAFAQVPGLPQQPAVIARELAEILSEGTSHRDQDRAGQERNAAFALLAMAVHELRSGGRYLFRSEPKMLERFCDGERVRKSPTR